jgi:hypothetical protein
VSCVPLNWSRRFCPYVPHTHYVSDVSELNLDVVKANVNVNEHLVTYGTVVQACVSSHLFLTC